MTHGLTPRQAEAVAFIKSYIGEHGFSPSFKEIARGLGIGANCGYVARLIHRLKVRGAIDFIPAHARSISVLNATGAPE